MRLRRLLDQLHVNFISQVKERRGAKLADNRDLFTGEIWVGETAQEVGLIDGIGHLDQVMKDRFGDKVKFRRYGRGRSLAQRLGLSLAEDALGLIEERAAYARFGL